MYSRRSRSRSRTRRATPMLRSRSRSVPARSRFRLRRSLVGATAVAKHAHHRWATALDGGTTSSVYGNAVGGTYSASTGVFTVNAGVVQAGQSFAFQLRDLPDYAEFTSLYDQYKINAVLVTVKMINNPNSIGVVNTNSGAAGGKWTTNNFYPTVWIAPDHDDVGAPTIQILKEYSRAKHRVLTPNREIKMLFKPTTLQQLYDGVATTAYAINHTRPWIDAANPEVPHYGCKIVFDFEGLTTGDADTGQFQFKINAKYYVTCKNAR